MANTLQYVDDFALYDLAPLTTCDVFVFNSRVCIAVATLFHDYIILRRSSAIAILDTAPQATIKMPIRKTILFV